MRPTLRAGAARARRRRSTVARPATCWERLRADRSAATAAAAAGELTRARRDPRRNGWPSSVVSESDEVLACKLVDDKVTDVHRRPGPAVLKLASGTAS